MLSLIEVTCPHCHAQGQIMVPPLGAIIVGPCPECHGMVAVFCGKVLGLDTEIMTQGATAERRDHVAMVLTRFIHERVGQLFEDEAEADELADAALDDAENFAEPGHPAAERAPRASHQDSPISPEEFASFRNVDLRLLDNSDYFRTIFHRDS